MLKRARGINQYGSLRLSISLDNLVLLTELIKLYIKAYLQKTFETKYIILINSCDVWLVEVICQLLRLQCGHCDSRKPCCT